ncbi:MAG: prepilin-type N-terminal cleavage/methylation domain-containing protein [Deltaproteobacteria bacterium]|nr:prepilin-type N-terminal cleavage/methylation domain-containing protein [Deltaproteobacteria bacterium]MBW2116250.1 prepilin-type N-terminal cleavage/methylation domain-containing protein [Deltaproteobacteria bacterium]
MLRNEKGFTLIEIIAVIIIMGILAAVAVPKFFSMQEDAKVAALHGALSEATARFNHAYAKYILVYKKAPFAITDHLNTVDLLGTSADTAPGTDIGDFKVTWNKQASGKLWIEIHSAEPNIPDATLNGMKTGDPVTDPTLKEVDGITWGPA